MEKSLPSLLKAVAFLALFSSAGLIKAQTAYATLNVVQGPELMATAGQDTGHCPLDSVQIGGLPAGMGGTGGYTYAWTPPAGLSNPNASNPMVSAATPTDYTLTVTDSLGCTSMDTINIALLVCVGVDGTIPGVNVSVRPNPTEGDFWLDITSDNGTEALEVVIYNPLGQKIHQADIEAGQMRYQEQFDLSREAAGIYFIEVASQRHRVVYKLIRR